MKWEKKGLVFNPAGRSSWMRHTALTPTPMLFGDRIRVWAGFRDDEGISRVGWVDVDASDPTRVLGFSTEPALDRGSDGCFDDNGVILGDVVAHDGKLHLFYVGFQLVKRVKFIALTGHATSVDGGNTFQRVSAAPFAGRSDEGLFCRAIHSIRRVDARWHVVYSAGADWKYIGGRPYPCYEIFETFLPSLEAPFPTQGRLLIPNRGEEYRIGRPRYFDLGGQPVIAFTAGTPSGSYLAGMSRQLADGSWQRDDAGLGLSPSASGWDAKHLCYPAFVTTSEGRTFCFYNGNDMGAEGFGVAELLNAK